MFHMMRMKVKANISYALVRAHLCTLAISLGFHSIWEVPKAGFRHGGLQYLLVHTAALLLLGLPITMLQFAAGQLSQQDVVGMWSAVPFFRGVGYLRLLITFLGCIHTLIYAALTVTYLLYTITNPGPFLDCIEMETKAGSYIYFDDLETENELCANHTMVSLMSDVEMPEYFVAVGLVVTALWLTLPFMLLNPLKYMKRIFYATGPVVLSLLLVVLAGMGQSGNLSAFYNELLWQKLVDPRIWQGALTQAFWSCQAAGGYLVSVGGNVYSSTDVRWTSLILIGANIISSWFGTLLWFSIAGSTEWDSTVSEISLLVQAYRMASEQRVSRTWPMLLFFTVFLSAIISLIALIYPIYDRFGRIGTPRWRVISVATSFVGVAFTLATLALRLTALHTLDEIVSPFLISFTSILEISAFAFIYGWKVLIEDVEFLISDELRLSWVLGWCAAPGMLAPVLAWWMTTIVMQSEDAWLQPPWEGVALLVTAGYAFVMFFIFACVTVARQVEYDIISKLLASFKPSRHWGPRDPITHYYWLAQREVDRTTGNRTRFNRRNLGQLSGLPITMMIPNNLQPRPTTEHKRRTHSDDWIYTIYRRQYSKCDDDYLNTLKPRPKSLDWDANGRSKRDLKKLYDLKPLSKNSVVVIEPVSFDPR